MDSLITAAIALAAGGWDKVRLVRAFSGASTIYPLTVGEWKLGIWEYSETGPGNTEIMRSHILIPGIQLTIPSQPSMYIDFNSPTISATFTSGGQYIAVLFTWD